MNYAVVFASAGAFVSAAMALMVAWYKRRSIAHWSLVAGLLAFSAESVFLALTLSADSAEAILSWYHLQLFATAFLPGTWLFFSLSYSRGNHRSFISKWRFLLALAFLVPLGLALWFNDQLVVITFDSLTKTYSFRLTQPGYALNLSVLLASVLVLMNLERTFRASVGTMRWRIKFMLLGLGIMFGVRAYSSSQFLLFHAIDPSLQTVNSITLFVACLLMLRSLSREGMDVNVYPSHTVLYNSLTVLLAGVYLVIVGLFAKVASSFGGDSSFTLKAFLVLAALVFLTVLLLSDRFRMRAKQFVSRHFKRPLYDYRTIWRSFTERTASRVEQTDLCRAIVRLVADIFQVLSVTIWLVDDENNKLVFSASTSLSEAKGRTLAPEGEKSREVLDALRNHPEPVDIDASTENWAVALRLCHPDEFRKGGSRVCVPIVLGGEILGLITLGDRVSGVPFLQEDFDLLKCIGDEAAAGLQNVQLSQKLLQAKELEAFQTMSAFFVHDLKNTASTLSLMLQNMSTHYDDPAFKQDALRGISKSVNHINDLIKRLTLFRKEAEMGVVESDLNQLVSSVLAEQPFSDKIKIANELSPLPKQRFDPQQMHKVVTNLILNARDAINGSGEIRLATGRQNGWVTLSVSDTGCGMTPDFAKNSLFRPFQTTKKNGIGIGMFQTKMIVEAHGGKIEVKTQVGQGTTFSVLLPVAAELK